MRRDVTSVPPSMHGTQNANINVTLVVPGTKLQTIVPHAQLWSKESYFTTPTQRSQWSTSIMDTSLREVM